MQRHFEKELEMLKTALIKMASLAERSVERAIQAVLTKNESLAHEVVEQDGRINDLEVEVDNAIIDLLALQQPVAVDLRFILSSSKINNDLERIGDHAVNIAESAVVLSKQHHLDNYFDIPKMSEITRDMLRDGLDAFIHGNAKLAEAVCRNDDTIDDLNRKVTKDVMKLMIAKPECVEECMDLIRISRNLERIADLTTNIAEEVIFIKEARVIKHHLADQKDTRKPPSQ